MAWRQAEQINAGLFVVVAVGIIGLFLFKLMPAQTQFQISVCQLFLFSLAPPGHKYDGYAHSNAESEVMKNDRMKTTELQQED
jgi:hypothetical protein